MVSPRDYVISIAHYRPAQLMKDRGI